MRHHIKYYLRYKQVSFSNCYNGINPIINSHSVIAHIDKDYNINLLKYIFDKYG
jgi:hypothetical protein